MDGCFKFFVLRWLGEKFFLCQSSFSSAPTPALNNDRFLIDIRDLKQARMVMAVMRQSEFYHLKNLESLMPYLIADIIF